MEKRIKSYIKVKDNSKNKEKTTYKILKVTKNLKDNNKIKGKIKDIIKVKNKREDIPNKNNNNKDHRTLKNYKSMAGILSDTETIKTETTRGDTLTECNKNKYVYRKSINKTNFSFAIKNFLSNKVQHTNCSAYEKKNRLNYSMSLNKFMKTTTNSDVNESALRTTNNNFYQRKSNIPIGNTYHSLMDQIFYGTNNQNYNTNNDISCLYERKEKDEFINIEDLLLLEEKFNEVIISVQTKNNTANECFELLNAYQQSSLFNNFENYFKDISSKTIVHLSIMYFIYNLIICYHFSFDIAFFNICYQ